MNQEYSVWNIFRSFKKLKGNTRTSVIFEPLWGVPYLLYNFYLSLYMKSQGITDEQIGFLIAIGFITSAVFALFGGIITDALGRKRTTLIFDLISWPASLAIYFVARDFWVFALATTVNSASKIVGVSWNLMVVEDATDEETLIAYNLFNITNVALGIVTPLAGLMVKWTGIVTGERILLAFATLSMVVMILGRNYCYRETRIGKRVLAERRRSHKKFSLDLGYFKDTISVLKLKPLLLTVLGIVVLFNAYLPIGTFTSLYYAPYLTEVLKLDKSLISVIGGISSATMFLIFVFLIPSFPHHRRIRYMTIGIGIQILSLIWFMISPPGSFISATLAIVLFAVGYGVSKPFLDTVLAAYTGGKERSGVFAVQNTMISVFGALGGFLSGYLYQLRPQLIYILSIGILMICLILLGILSVYQRKANLLPLDEAANSVE